MFCPHCGTNLPDGSKFCSNCGSPVSMGANAGFGTSDQNAEQAQPFAQAPYDAQEGGPVPPSSTYVPPYQQDSFTSSYAYQEPAPTVVTAPSGPTPAGALQTDRDLVAYILLTIITCGIYGMWYIHRMAQDTNVICQDDDEQTPGLAVYILLSLVTCGIYSYYWMYKLANRLQQNAPRYGVSIQEAGSDVLLWLILGIFTCGICSFFAVSILIQNLNSLSDAYNRANGYLT